MTGFGERGDEGCFFCFFSSLLSSFSLGKGCVEESETFKLGWIDS